MATDTPLDPLARRLCAAVLSYRMGIKHVDYYIKHYLSQPEPVGDYWQELAARVLLESTIADRSPTPKRGPRLVK